MSESKVKSIANLLLLSGNGSADEGRIEPVLLSLELNPLTRTKGNVEEKVKIKDLFLN